MTILELRNLFDSETKIYVRGYDEGSPVILVTNLLCGTQGFSHIEIIGRNVKSIKKNTIEVTIDIPVPVLEAWKKYSDDYYNAESIRDYTAK